jgi:hypothetical protein
MALLDLSLVTSALVKLLDENIKASSAWGATPGLAVSAIAPDRLAGDAALGMYLYHVSEDAAFKNKEWPGRPASPIRYSPMGIDLHYVLSAHSDLEGELSPLREQLMMGLALKTLHDFPLIDDTTMVSGVRIFPTTLSDSDNKLRISWRPVPPHEAVSYWTAGSQPLRLSAYYEVQVILLEPDEPPAAAGRVLTYNLFTFVGGLPSLDASRSKVTFTLPIETLARTVEVQPAQCAIDDDIALIGANLSGDTVALLVRPPGKADPVQADPAWGGTSNGSELFAKVRRTLNGVVVIPGTYGAVVKTTHRFVGGDGVTRIAEQLSNETPFVVVPGVVAISLLSLTGVFTMTGGIFQDAAIAAASVRIYIADQQLVAGTAGALSSGQYAVLDATHVELRLPTGLTPGTFARVRIAINGAESPPNWIAVP